MPCVMTRVALRGSRDLTVDVKDGLKTCEVQQDLTR